MQMDVMNLKKPYKVKSKIVWKWLGREIHGHVVEVYFEPVTKTIKDKKIKRNGSPDCPAYLVQSTAGNLALKLHTELFVQGSDKATTNRPKIFS